MPVLFEDGFDWYAEGAALRADPTIRAQAAAHLNVAASLRATGDYEGARSVLRFVHGLTHFGLGEVVVNGKRLWPSGERHPPAWGAAQDWKG